MDKTQRVLAEVEALEERLGHFNSWPDEPIVALRTYNLADPKSAYDFGHLYGFAQAVGVVRQPRRVDIPVEVVQAASPRTIPMNNNIFFTYVSVYGETSDFHLRNLRAVIPAVKQYSFGKQVFITPGAVVELGCAHDYEGTGRGNCWAAFRCQRCGHSYEVDSSG